MTIAYPQSLEDLVSLCASRPSRQHDHAAGSHWALSAAAVSEDVFIETNDVHEVFPALGRTLNEVVGYDTATGKRGCLNHDFVAWINGRFPAGPADFYFADPVCELSGDHDLVTAALAAARASHGGSRLIHRRLRGTRPRRHCHHQVAPTKSASTLAHNTALTARH
jgi:hypothetical protein